MDDQNFKDFEILAGYMPSQFYIELHSPFFQKPAAGELIKLNPQNCPVFLHEVGHSVQDRATYRGVIDFLDSWDRAFAVADYIRESDGEISIPIVDLKTGQLRINPKYRWALETDLLRSFREPRICWESKGRYWKYQGYEVQEVESRLDGRRVKVPVVTVNFVEEKSGDEYKHPLGAWEIKEAYSVAIGYVHGCEPKEFGIHEFQYLAVERILGSIFGAVSPQQTIAICHWALQELSPAYTFFQIIEHFEKSNQLPDAESIYDWARNEAMDRGFKQKIENVLSDIKKYSEVYGQRAPVLGGVFAWYLEHTGELLKKHLDTIKRFPLDTLLCNSIDWNEGEEHVTNKLKNFFIEVEVPLECYSIKTTGELTVRSVFLNRAMLETISKLWMGRNATWTCPIYNACEHPCKNDNICLTKPWHQADQVQQCPYGAAAKLIGLSGKHSLKYKPFTELD